MTRQASSLHKTGNIVVDRAQLHGKNRAKLVTMMKERGAHGIALFEGGKAFHLYSTDGELLFRQDGYFFYLFGIREEGFSGAINIEDGTTTLFMPRLPDSYAVWMGTLETPVDIKATYSVDHVLYVDELESWLQASSSRCIHVLDGENSDSGMKVASPSVSSLIQGKIVRNELFNVLTECRVKKSAEEIEIIRYANRIGSRAHVQVMQRCKQGMNGSVGLKEYQLESTFLHYCYDVGGCRTAMYTPISAAGPNSAILHYGHAGAPNEREIVDGDMVLCDFGCSIYNYGSDITTTFPANGKFTEDQKLIYEAVLKANEAVKAAMRPSVSWPDMHTLANRVILASLKEGGLLKGDIDEMIEADIGALFMPHGLGHFLGLDTHDVGGYLEGFPERIQRPGLKSLRTARALEAGMVITCEPGCYFNPALLLPAFIEPKKNKFLVEQRIRGFIGSGGVRVEDNIIITDDGIENLTSVPRSVAEIERVMAGGVWP